MTEEAQVPGGAGRALVLTCAPGHRGLHFDQPFQNGHRALRKDSVKVRIWQRRLYFNISVGKWRYSLCNNSVRESGGSVYVVSGIEWEDGQEFNPQHRNVFFNVNKRVTNCQMVAEKFKDWKTNLTDFTTISQSQTLLSFTTTAFRLWR